MRLITEQGYPIVEAARNLGLNAQLLSRWVREYRDLPGDAFRGNGNLSREQAEIQMLRKENKRLKMEREILKKATAFFVQESR